MKVTFEKVDTPEKEMAHIRALSDEGVVRAAIDLLEGGKKKIPLQREGETVLLETGAVYYIESVDKKTFVYTRENCYGCKQRLYELEDSLGVYFSRISKSMIVNLRKIKGVRSDLSGRMEATLLNGEKIVVSRSYVKEIKRRLDL